MKKAWWKESVVYEIYTRSFCDSNGDGIGDLGGIISKLDYLKELGVNVLWLAPIYQSPNDDNGYDISDYRNIMTEFGSMADFDTLLEEAHKRGLRIVMDLVANHSSDEHEWFKASKASIDNDKRDYYIWKDPVDGHEPTNWGSCFGGSAWEYDENTKQYYLHCFSKKQPDLNWDNPKVRKEIFDIMKFWLDKGIDGFRMDVISMISKSEYTDGPLVNGLYADCGRRVSFGPHLHEYLQEMNREVLSKYDTITVGECGGVTTEEAKKIANADGSELGMVFQFEHVNLDGDENGKWCHKPMDLPVLKKNLQKWQEELHEKAWNSLYFNNHDQPRVVSRLGDNSPVSAKAVATALYMMQGTPYMYQGEELGMTNYPFKSIDEYDDIECINAYKQLTENGIREPEELLDAIAYKSRDNARTPIQWSAEKNAGFTTGEPWMKVNPNYIEINAEAQVGDPDSVFTYYKKLIELRCRSSFKDLLVYGKTELLVPEDKAVYAYTRTYEDRKALVICNLSGETVSLADTFSTGNEFAGRKSLLSSYGESVFIEGMSLKPWEAAVWCM